MSTADHPASFASASPLRVLCKTASQASEPTSIGIDQVKKPSGPPSITGVFQAQAR